MIKMNGDAICDYCGDSLPDGYGAVHPLDRIQRYARGPQRSHRHLCDECFDTFAECEACGRRMPQCRTVNGMPVSDVVCACLDCRGLTIEDIR